MRQATAEQQDLVASLVEGVLGRPMAFPVDYCGTLYAELARAVFGVDVLGNRLRSFATEDEARAAYPLGLAVTTARRLRDELGWRRVSMADAPIGAAAIVRPEKGGGHCVGGYIGDGWVMVRSGKGVRLVRAGMCDGKGKPLIVDMYAPAGGT